MNEIILTPTVVEWATLLQWIMGGSKAPAKDLYQEEAEAEMRALAPFDWPPDVWTEVIFRQ